MSLHRVRLGTKYIHQSLRVTQPASSYTVSSRAIWLSVITTSV